MIGCWVIKMAYNPPTDYGEDDLIDDDLVERDLEHIRDDAIDTKREEEERN